MDEAELFENQYGSKKLITENGGGGVLRGYLRRYDLHREELTLSMLEKGEKLLDIGCGEGSLMMRAAGMYRDLHGIDISGSRIEEARRRAAVLDTAVNGPSLHFDVCNVNRGIDFADGMFDAVTVIAVMQYVYDPFELMMELGRIIKPGGIIVAQVPNIAYIKQRALMLAGRLPVTSSRYNWREIGWDGGSLHYFTKNTFCQLIEGAGFSIEEVSGSGVFARLRNFYPSLLTGDLCVKARKTGT